MKIGICKRKGLRLMIKSMTGYGRFQQTIDGREILVEIKSVNHRYFEFSARVPRAYGYLEEKLKTFVQSRVSRGKVDVGVTIFNVEGKDAQIEVNQSIAAGYVNALRKANESLKLKDDLSLSNLIRLPDIFNVIKTAEDETVIWNSVKVVAEEALNNFVSMRETEGLKMMDDIRSRLGYIKELVDMVE